MYLITCVIAGIRLDHRSCEVLEAVLSRMQMTTLDLERTNLDDEVRQGQFLLFFLLESIHLPLSLSLSYLGCYCVV